MFMAFFRFLKVYDQVLELSLREAKLLPVCSCLTFLQVDFRVTSAALHVFVVEEFS